MSEGLGQGSIAVTTVLTSGDLAELGVAGVLLDAFNREYDDPTPGPDVLAMRLAALLAAGDTDVLLVRPAVRVSGGVGDSADSGNDAGTGATWSGVAVLRYRASLWTPAREATLAELYVTPRLRGQGLGRPLITAAIDRAAQQGVDYLEVVTSDDDVAAWRLYESVGFRRTEGEEGPLTRFYEQDLAPTDGSHTIG